MPFFSGEFDDPNYDDVNNPTSQAGITCTVCHAITNVNSTRGNADYTIEEPQHYPFASSENPVLQWINNTLVKAKPEMHKKTFLKPVIKDSKFCSTCHKVGLPYALNHYKDFLRGQNHYDTFLLSGVSGHGARSFYYPPVAKANCVDCHMELDAVARLRRAGLRRQGRPRDPQPPLPRRQHRPGRRSAATTTAAERPREVPRRTRRSASTSSPCAKAAAIDGQLLGPLRPEVPDAQAGQHVPGRGRGPDARPRPPVQPGDGRLERDLGRADRAAGDRRDRPLGRDRRRTARSIPYSHFINVYMLDRDGNRIDRRNPQDIFVPLYNKQIPPGAGQVVHFGLEVPDGDRRADHARGQGQLPQVRPQVHGLHLRQGEGARAAGRRDGSDAVQLPVEGGPAATNEPSPIKDDLAALE